MKPTTLLLAATLALSACGSGETARPTDGVPPDTVVLTVRDEGGFAPVEDLFGRHPRYVLQADGRLYAPGAVPAIYPGPMLTPLFVGTVDEATIERILALVAATGLPDIDRLEDTTAAGTVADGTTTVFTYFDGTVEHVLSVYALGLAPAGSPVAQAAADLIAALDAAAADLGDVREYQPTRVEIRTGDRLALPDPEFRTTRPWPLAVAPSELPEAAHGWRCLVVEGPPAGDLMDIFRVADQATTWEHAGTEHALIARGLLPGETGCA